MNVSQKVKFHRKSLGLSVTALSEKIGMNPNTLWMIENKEARRPSAEKLSRLAKFFHVTVEYLIDDDMQEIPDTEKDQALLRRIWRLDATKRSYLDKFIDSMEDNYERENSDGCREEPLVVHDLKSRVYSVP